MPQVASTSTCSSMANRAVSRAACLSGATVCRSRVGAYVVRKDQGGCLMSGNTELADGGFGRSLPAEWGRPPGSQFSEERATWIREQVRRHVATGPLRELAARDRRLLNVL